MSYETHDSGEREDYDSGMVRDTNKGKPRFDLLLPDGVPYKEQMLTRWAALMARGAGKYGDRNWEQAEGSEELRRFRDSAFRHFMMWFSGVDDGEDHAAAVFFNITAAEYVKHKMRGAELRERYLAAVRTGKGQPIEIIDLEPKGGPDYIIKFTKPISSDLANMIAKVFSRRTRHAT